MLSLLWCYVGVYGLVPIGLFCHMTKSDHWINRKPTRPRQFRLAWLMGGILLLALAYAVVGLTVPRPRNVGRLTTIDAATVFTAVCLTLFSRSSPLEIMVISAIVALSGVIFFFPSVGVA